jgi:hypothetical protein
MIQVAIIIILLVSEVVDCLIIIPRVCMRSKG